MNTILDKLGALIAELKAKNESISVSVCELVPTLMLGGMQEKISNFNIKLTDWCARNGISLISTELCFRFGTGEMDTSCYVFEEDTVSHELNRIGAVRLLDAISKKGSKLHML